MSTGPLRVANCSGFFGDRLSAAREMVEGGPIDVLTGDWLAELTMYILHKTRLRSGGFAGTFVRQMEEVLPTCVERGIKVVANAGGLDPAGAASAVRALAERQGVTARVASVGGDDLSSRLAWTEGLRRDVGQPRHRRGAPPGRRGGHGQRLPRRGPHRRGPLRRGRRGGDGAGHRRLFGGGSGHLGLRVGTRGPRRAGRGGGGRPRHRVRGAVLRRQLRLLRGGAGAGPGRVPSRRAVARRLGGHHQAPRDRGRGHRRHGHRPAPLRDRRSALPEPRRGGQVRHHRPRPGGARPRADQRDEGGAPAPRPEGHRQPGRRLAQRRHLRPHRRRGAREGRRGRGRALGGGARRAGGVRRDGGRALRRSLGPRGGLPAGGGARRRRADGRARVLGRGRGDRAGQLPRRLLHRPALGRPGGGPLLADHRGRRARRPRRRGGRGARGARPGLGRPAHRPAPPAAPGPVPGGAPVPGPVGDTAAHRPPGGAGGGALGRQGGHRQRRLLGRRRRPLLVAGRRPRCGAVPPAPPRGGGSGRRPPCAGQPAGGQFRGPRPARPRGGVQPPSRRPGQGTGRAGRARGPWRCRRPWSRTDRRRRAWRRGTANSEGMCTKFGRGRASVVDNE